MKAACRDLGKMDYKNCWDLQQTIFNALLAAKSSSAVETQEQARHNPLPEAPKAGEILLVEHPPVYTLGKSGHAENLLINRAELERLGAQFFHIDRGGDITFHGPGQLVVYPILDLEHLGIGLRDYIHTLEEAVIRTVACYGIDAGRIPGASGVWISGLQAAAAPNAGHAQCAGTERTAESGQHAQCADTDRTAESGQRAQCAGTDRTAESGQHAQCADTDQTAGSHGRKAAAPRKICAIGVRSSRYVTMHGLALNVATDLGWFSRINPCGFTDRGVTSMEREVGRKIPMGEVKALMVKFLSGLLNVKIYNK